MDNPTASQLTDRLSAHLHSQHSTTLTSRSQAEYWDTDAVQSFRTFNTPGALTASFSRPDGHCSIETFEVSHMLGSSGLYGEAYLGTSRIGQQAVLKYFKTIDMEFGEFCVDRFMEEVDVLWQ